MEKRQKDILRPLVAGLRRLLAGTADGSRRGDLDRELERLGIAPDGSVTILDALPTLSPAERRARTVAEAELEGLADPKARTAARAAFIERAAYGWIDRLLALRVLEARKLIDGTLRANPDYDGLSEALYLLRQGEPGRASGPDGGWWAVIEDACAAQAAALPGLFALDADSRTGASRHAGDTLGDPAIALRPSTAALLDCVALLGDAPAGTPHGRAESVRAEMDAAFADPDAIGWAYQFYQEEAKAQVYLRLKAGKKVVTRDEIAAATQLFTEPYMVKWLLQNSLGRSYHEAYPHSALPAGWEYYIRPERLDPPAFSTLAGLSLLDPCMGSGHFLREAFDMFVAMYREQQPDLSAAEIADRILAEHLHGIDIDPRAAGLAAFTLYARAWELLRDERRSRRQAGTGSYTPTAMNLATTPDRIAPGALARHLERHPEDRMLEALLRGVFAALEQADILGSLLRPREHLQAAVAKLRHLHQLQLGTVEEQELQAAIEAVAQSDPAHLEEMLLDRVAAGFAIEARGVGDVAAQLFGRAAERGVRLLQLLDRQYAVVVTNPPYMGSKNMDTTTLKYVERHYPSGKRDLYATFILRNLELACPGGRVAMVTQQSWMFLSSFADLRAVPEEELAAMRKKGGFTGLLRETSLETLAHLGPNAFEEISGEVVQCALFVTARHLPRPDHCFVALRLTGASGPDAKSNMLVQADKGAFRYAREQDSVFKVNKSPIIYHLPLGLLALITNERRLEDIAYIRQGVCTTDEIRFLRYDWEVVDHSRWAGVEKVAGYSRWFSLEMRRIDWTNDGARIKTNIDQRPDQFTWTMRMPSSAIFFLPGLSYSVVGRGALGVRFLSDSIFPDKNPFISSPTRHLPCLAAYLNSHVATALIRVLAQGIEFREGYLGIVPFPHSIEEHSTIGAMATACCVIKMSELSTISTHRRFTKIMLDQNPQYRLQADRAAIEGAIEYGIRAALGLSHDEGSYIDAETGVPAGFRPLLDGYDGKPSGFLSGFGLDQVDRFLASCKRRTIDSPGMFRLKIRLRAMYEAGPGGNQAEEAAGEQARITDEDDGATIEAHSPIPPDTFLDELAQNLDIHPISVYWLLREIRAEGARCKPEEQRLLEDRLSVLVLRLLGHRWPKQLEAGEPVPDWSDRDGIIPLLPGAGETTLAERLRDRLRAEDGDLGAQQAEALLAELTGQDLETWLRRAFFPRHVRQFKYRPIAWHLASVPEAATGKGRGGKGTGGTRRTPAFECLVYAHACGAGMLAKIRTQYLEPLLRTGRGREGAARQSGDDTAAAQAHALVAELEAFAARLRGVEEAGFACPELDAALVGEPLDRHCGDGILAPDSPDALLARERAWAVDINDGVRVNVAPLQLAGALAAAVLKEPDARKAIADRVRWRADERRWVREGVLPRCGWMGEAIPESPRWTERAPERAAEAAKLARKRAEALARMGAER